MKTVVQKITPGWAKDVLANRNTINRRMEPKRVRLYADAMRRGEWILTHQGIAFDEDGILIDGQTRLAAVVDYAQPVEMMVTLGMPRTVTTSAGVTVNAIDPLDRCRPRSLAQTLQLGHGVVNACQVAAISAILRTCVNPAAHGIPLAVSQVIAIRDIYGKSFDYVLAANWQKGDRKAGIQAAFIAYHSSHQTQAEEFITQVNEMNGLPAKSPALVWRKWVMNNLVNGITCRSDRLTVCHIAAMACVKHLANEECAILKDSPVGMNKLLADNKTGLASMRAMFCKD